MSCKYITHTRSYWHTCKLPGTRYMFKTKYKNKIKIITAAAATTDSSERTIVANTHKIKNQEVLFSSSFKKYRVRLPSKYCYKESCFLKYIPGINNKFYVFYYLSFYRNTFIIFILPAQPKKLLSNPPQSWVVLCPRPTNQPTPPPCSH